MPAPVARILLLIAALTTAALAEHAWSSWECKKDPGKTCLFRNVIYNAEINNYEMFIPSSQEVGEPPLVSRSAKFDFMMHPVIRRVDEATRNKELDRVVETFEGYTVGANFLWHHNIGHYLFDGLYALYNAALRYLSTPEQNFRLIMSHDKCIETEESQRVCRKSEDIAARFSGHEEFVNWALLRDKYKGKGHVLIRNLIMGSGELGVHTYNTTFRLGETVPDAIRLYRNRLLRSQGVTLREPFTPDPSDVVKVLFIDNKRYTPDDRKNIALAIGRINNDTTLRINVEYVNWQFVGHKDYPTQFATQLRLTTEAAVYVSGPGTGLLYHPFMADGSVVVNLGGLYSSHPTCKMANCTFPNFMECHVAASAWRYQRALYYDSRTRFEGLKPDRLVDLIKRSRAYIGRPAIIEETLIGGRDPGWTNLSPEAQLLEDACSLPSRPCFDLVEACNNNRGKDGWYCVHSSWPDQIVYEGEFNAEGGIWDPKRNMTLACPYLPRGLLREFRKIPRYASVLAKPVFARSTPCPV